MRVVHVIRFLYVIILRVGAHRTVVSTRNPQTYRQALRTTRHFFSPDNQLRLSTAIILAILKLDKTTKKKALFGMEAHRMTPLTNS